MRQSFKRFIFPLLILLLANVGIMAQNITIRAVERPAQEVFRKIMEQTDMNFVYSTDLLKNKKISVDAANKPLRQVLNEIFKDGDITYKIKGKNVILKRKEKGKEKKTREIKTELQSLATEIDSLPSPGYDLDEVIVRATGAERNLNAAEMGRHVISSEAISKLPVLFGEPDVIKTLQTLPGVSQGVEGFSGLYVHGGNNDQNLFSYNGIPLYHVAHLGGIFSSFNVSTISRIDFFKSAFPARFGGRISSITDITMNTPDFDTYKGKFTVGLLAFNGYITGPILKDRLAFSAGIRRSWIDIVGLPALSIFNSIQKKDGKKTMAAYNFMDFNARIDWRLDDGKIYAIGYYGHDYLKMGQKEFGNYFDENRNTLSWGNWGISLNADFTAGDGNINATAYYTKYTSRYGQTNEHQTDLEDPETYSRTFNSTYNSIADVGINARYARQWGETWLVKAGAGYVYHNYHPEGIINEFADDDRNWNDNNGNPSVKSNEIFAYVDNLFNFGERASLDVGLRFVDHFISGTSFPRIEPRISLRLNLTHDYSLKASYARINQFVQQVSSNYITLPTDLWQPIGNGKRPLSSDQYSLGLYGNLPWYDLYFSLEGWYKRMENLVEYHPGISTLNPNLPWEDKTVTGQGWAYGADLTVTKEIGKVTGTVSYGLMWNWRKFAELNDGKRFPAKFDNRNKINITANYRLNEKIEFNASWTYMTGNRLTLSLYNYDIPGADFHDSPSSTDDGKHDGLYFEQLTGLGYISGRNNVRLPAYHRLDVGMSLYKTLRNGRRTIWNFSLYNAYCHLNTITIVKQNIYNGDEPPKREFRKLGLIPVIPSVSWTYEF